ncbi:large-conductance mechanosensitive channel protein MscL [Arenimonas caeni]|jgi:large conductance mechanosensitive channel|uniref:Large-conductance mechanosensitive channel n=1 Tax=Arenimonas caeni TaxID=2058085 RepID=A0A2P6MAJ3_9GAMM|nr:large-conductance mechanosensitive channel protein MscL [Arenimonas caeni]MDY0021953.1 large-conductance mechanosensitive channel protein MscL [Arenimonas caeni]PRH83019.1 large conductance mechanosensitive channel protein MscL [Arenimonas caeni]
MGMLSEFKEFAMRGNVVDLAVGVVIGAAFGKIVASLVNDIIMPAVGYIVGGVDFSDLAIVLKEATVDAAGAEVPAVLVKYGAFVQTVVDFLIIAFAIFVAVKVINSLKRKQDAAPAAPPEPSDEVKLLTEIRDALKSR